jgi:hypothetical protein
MSHTSRELDVARWLTSPDADSYLADSSLATPTPARVAQLRRTLAADQVSALLTQAQLRVKARSKFPHTEQLFFTHLGLEQATDATTAAYKARRFPPDHPIADLCCGVGGDALALAHRAPLALVDSDPVSAHFATTNIQRHSGCVPRVFPQAIDASQLQDVHAWHIDPDRRPQGRRTTTPELHSPGVEEIDDLRRGSPNVAIKLAPAAKVPQHWLEQAEAEWIACDGTCRALILWFGSLTSAPGTRRATLLHARRHPNGQLLLPDPYLDCQHTLTAADVGPRASVAPLGRYVYDPHPALVAARLVDHLAHQFQLTRWHRDHAYLTSDQCVSIPGLAAFQVIDVLPIDLKQLKTYLAAHRIGQLELKQRGAELDLQRLARQLAGAGDQTAVILFAENNSGRAAVIARRVTS